MTESMIGAWKALVERDFSRSRFGPTLYDQFGRPVERTWAPPKIGETLTIRKPIRWQTQVDSSRMQQEAQDAAHKRLLEEYGPEGLVGQQ